MEPFIAPDPDFASRVRASFGKQSIMALLQASLERVAAGEVDVSLAIRPEVTQQHGFVHAGVVTTIVDSACGYAALSLMPGLDSAVGRCAKVHVAEWATARRHRRDAEAAT
ncbi:MAG: PaaI family thioesterase [Archangiaceae bacterium]|nr:PaaI family thioesterase [Archangiaceae bacterium]